MNIRGSLFDISPKQYSDEVMLQKQLLFAEAVTCYLQSQRFMSVNYTLWVNVEIQGKWLL